MIGVVASVVFIAAAAIVSGIEHRKRDSLRSRRLIGLAFVIALVLLGLALPAVI